MAKFDLIGRGGRVIDLAQAIDGVHVTGDFGMNPDEVGVRSGVTGVVDRGTCPQLKEILAR
jgi:hypothetical protein